MDAARRKEGSLRRRMMANYWGVSMVARMILVALLLPCSGSPPFKQIDLPTWLGVNNMSPLATAVTVAPLTGDLWLVAPIPQPNPRYMPTFLYALTERVKRVAAKAKENYDNACGTLKRCKMQYTPCLRLTCGYQNSDNLTCTEGFEFRESECNPTGGSPFKDKPWEFLWVDFHQPYLRLPSVDDLSSHKKVNETIMEHSCIHGPLRGILKSAVTQEEYLVTGALYFGSVVGIFLGMPGMNRFMRDKQEFPFDCEFYDPRHRPWFAEASSPKKRVSILVDLTGSMDSQHSEFGFFDQTPRLDVLKRTLYRLTKTFREFDKVALTIFPPNVSLDIKEETVLAIDNPLRCLSLNASFDKMVPNATNGDLTEGIQRALSKLENMTSDRHDVEILLVFTRGQVNVDAAANAIVGYNNRTGRTVPVFLYGVDVTEFTAFENFTKLATTVNGTARVMGIGDPLLGIYSYFNYLAQFYSHVEQPFWVEEYNHATYLGPVTTHVQPVYDTWGHFIGVAAMDVRKLQGDSRAKFEELIKNHTPITKPSSQTNLKDTLKLSDCTQASWPCYDGLDSVHCHNVDPKSLHYSDHNVICRRETRSPERLKCCSSKSLMPGVVMPGVVWTLLGAAAIVLLISLDSLETSLP